MRTSADAFTRLDLLVTVLALSAVIGIASPLWAGSRSGSQRAGCFNNLRQIGRAVQLWGDDHNDRQPWITPVAEGGTQAIPKSAAASVGYISLSNELVSPRILACPSDGQTKAASNWGNTANGFANSGFRGAALSYFVNYHSQPDRPRSPMSGDRDFRPTFAGPVSCSRGPINAAQIVANDLTVAWTNLVHVGAGHLVFTDGSVEYTVSPNLARAFIAPTGSDSSSIHFLNAR